jgi:hypothetical protein
MVLERLRLQLAILHYTQETRLHHISAWSLVSIQHLQLCFHHIQVLIHKAESESFLAVSKPYCELDFELGTLQGDTHFDLASMLKNLHTLIGHLLLKSCHQHLGLELQVSSKVVSLD